MKQLALGSDVRAPIIRVVMVSTVVTPGTQEHTSTHRFFDQPFNNIFPQREMYLVVGLSFCKTVSQALVPVPASQIIPVINI